MSGAGRGGPGVRGRPGLTRRPAVPAACGGVHERTFLAVKPDGVQRRLVGEVVRRFERKGFKLVALKLVQVRAGRAGRARGRAGGRGPRRTRPVPLPPQASEELLREHYAELRERPFYGRLLKYMGSGPVVAMVSAGRRAGGRAVPARADPAPARRCGRGWTSCAPRGRSSAPRTRPPPLPAPSAGISASRSASKAGPRDFLSPVPTAPAALRGPCPSSARAHARPSRAGT